MYICITWSKILLRYVISPWASLTTAALIAIIFSIGAVFCFVLKSKGSSLLSGKKSADRKQLIVLIKLTIHIAASLVCWVPLLVVFWIVIVKIAFGIAPSQCSSDGRCPMMCIVSYFPLLIAYIIGLILLLSRPFLYSVIFLFTEPELGTSVCLKQFHQKLKHSTHTNKFQY